MLFTVFTPADMWSEAGKPEITCHLFDPVTDIEPLQVSSNPHNVGLALAFGLVSSFQGMVLHVLQKGLGVNSVLNRV
jgi:hypothetical protein